MQALRTKKAKTQLLFIAACLLSGLFLIGLFFNPAKIYHPKTITMHDVITFTIPSDWILYHKSKNYDFDIGYFKNHSEKNELLCNINTITANLNSSPSFEQFLNTSMAGKMLLDRHDTVKIAGQDAWRGEYEFPQKTITSPVKNERVLFKWKGVYIDITLSYNFNIDSNEIGKCKRTFETFLHETITK